MHTTIDPAPRVNGIHPSAMIHPTAEVSTAASIGADCKIWRQAHVRERAHLGDGCIIGAAVYVGAEVHLGRNCKVQNQALLYEGVRLEDGVFVGPQVCFTNDYLPRAVNPDLSLKSADDWHVGSTLVREGASVGAASVVVTGITIGRWALIGAGSVVTRDVPDHALAYGTPARIRGWVCSCARPLTLRSTAGVTSGWCETCHQLTQLPAEASSFTGEQDA
jgi:UDP-2-acetamido-3-amino-2,3-dideoxy-glucuronate N-acetyltransferase